MLGEMTEPLAEKSIKFSFDREAEKAIAKLAYSDKYGARDIRRIIRKEVEDKIANIMIDSDDARLSEIVVTAENGEIKVNGIEM